MGEEKAVWAAGKKKDHLFLNGRIKMKQMATVADKPTLTDS